MRRHAASVISVRRCSGSLEASWLKTSDEPELMKSVSDAFWLRTGRSYQPEGRRQRYCIGTPGIVNRQIASDSVFKCLLFLIVNLTMTVENDASSCGTAMPAFDGTDVWLDLNLFYIRQIGASLRKHVGIQDKLEREIKLRDGAARMLAACTHEDQLLEVAKTLHTSNARMYTYMAELQKLKTAEIMEKVLDEDGITGESKICTGRVAISDIRIPLMWNDPERFSGAKVKEASRYVVFCLVRVGSEVQDTELVCTDKTTTDLAFRDVLVFEDAAHNFSMDIEIHAFPMSEESISAPTPQKLMSRLNRSIGKSEGKRIRDRLKESPAANMKMGPQFEKLGSLTLDLRSVDDHIRSHDIEKICRPTCSSNRLKPLLPLYGSLTCRLVAQPKCMTEKCMTGFLHCMEVGNGPPCWSYVWCEVKAGKFQCWLNPEDSASRKPQSSIDMIAPDVKINEIEKNRQKRPNSFQVRDVTTRHLFSASTKEEMSRWIKNLRQHKADYAAWSVACFSEGNGAQPMFIASPSPYKASSHLLFDPSAKKTLIYEQMSMDSPTKSDSEAFEVSDLLRKADCTPEPAAVDTNQSTPWAGLFSGALSRKSMKVTKLKDVQNIASDDLSQPRRRSKTDEMTISSGRSSKKKDGARPPVPRRPSSETAKGKKKLYVKSLTAAKPVPKIEDLKWDNAPQECSSDLGQSSDDVFLSSDENLLSSRSGRGKATKERKKRRAPPPPLQAGSQVNSSSGKTSTRSTSKGSLSSASSLDDILDKEPRKPPRPAAAVASRSVTKSSRMYSQCSEQDGRKSQISLSSNSTQASNASSGYKSDSEGASTVVSRQPEYEMAVVDRKVKMKGRTGVKVLPTELPAGVKLTPHKFSRSRSWDSDALLSGENNTAEEVVSRSRFPSTPVSSKRPNLPALGSARKREMLVAQMLTPRESPSAFVKPTPTPRRSYLTAVESSKIVPPSPLCGVRDSADDPDYQEIDDICAVPSPKSQRPPSQKAAVLEQPEPIYAQVDKSRKKKAMQRNGGETPRQSGVESRTEAASACKERMEDEVVYV